MGKTLNLLKKLFYEVYFFDPSLRFIFLLMRIKGLSAIRISVSRKSVDFLPILKAKEPKKKTPTKGRFLNIKLFSRIEIKSCQF